MGGGIRSVEKARELLHAGADKLTINSYALENPKILSKLAEEFGSQAIVASLQLKKIGNEYTVMSYNGREPFGKKLSDWIIELQELGAGEVMITSIDQEGTCRGFDIELLKQIKQLTHVPLICSGGIANDIHAEECFANGADAAAIAAAFHFKKTSIKEIKTNLLAKGVDIRQ